MTARYVFWRQPNGTPYKSNDGRHSPKEILNQIGLGTKLSKEGQLAWSHELFVRKNVAIGSAIVIDPDGRQLNHYDAKRIIQSALYATVKNNGVGIPINHHELLREADNHAARFFRKSAKPYSLVTSLPMTNFPARQITIDGSLIKPLRSLNHFPLPEELHREPLINSIWVNRSESGHKLIRVQTSGRSSFEAFDKSSRALRLLCAIWNLYETMGTWTTSINVGLPRKKPMGLVHIGPIQLLYDKDGKSADNLIWYEPEYCEHASSFTPQEGWNGLEDIRRRACAKIRSTPYRDELQRLLVRYADAVAKGDPGTAFLLMWGILESITDTIASKYDETIKRATWFMQEADTSREILNHLRAHRNLFVHAGQTIDADDSFFQFIKSYVDVHLNTLINNTFKVKSLSEYGKFLSLPRSTDALAQVKKHCNRALEIRQRLRSR